MFLAPVLSQFRILIKSRFGLQCCRCGFIFFLPFWKKSFVRQIPVHHLSAELWSQQAGRNWHEVKPVGVAELQLVCLHARAREQEGLQVMVPVPAHILISHERLREILKEASLPPEDPDTPLSVTLAIVETDSTIVYYKMTDGFVMPDPPDDTEDGDNKQWRKKRKKLFK
ncbi:PREDICTED: tRNA-splicing endonuclease subunit Sen15 isoform X2 [Lepidothrix coronata]|uniref:tRNA-splicing endonuclease subunit Sen15 isoform X2 n=1 Tax=Lepidothrix coronata TaxID=321398 RepID=A0A6J0IUZ3_9PASS|nr:PREDICTED: tRNA-splicing endonuclease subunit Sen15 isoform X2 [Lepidothrix coronata]